MAAAAPARRKPKLRLAVGDYLTDGARLVEVRQVLGEYVVLEEGSVEDPVLTRLTPGEIDAGGWRRVEFVPYEGDGG